MRLDRLQRENQEWARHNFPDAKAHHPLLGALEELGELAHAHLKWEQGIREYADTDAIDKFLAAAEDAVGDVIIYLAHYCTLNDMDLANAVEVAWEEVKLRDWQKNPGGPS